MEIIVGLIIRQINPLSFFNPTFNHNVDDISPAQKMAITH